MIGSLAANVKNKYSNDMREEILSIACDLKEGSMTLNEAQTQLLRLLSVGNAKRPSCPKCRDNLYTVTSVLTFNCHCLRCDYIWAK